MKKQLKRNANLDREEPSPIPLTGGELLAKLAEIGNASKSEQVRACGYLIKRKNPEKPERLNLTGFYKALEEARGNTNQQTLRKSKVRLTGSKLLEKVSELKGELRPEIVRECGYTSTKEDGSERLEFQKFYSALKKAKRASPKELLRLDNFEKKAYEEHTSLDKQSLDSLRQAQRSRALDKLSNNVPSSSNKNSPYRIAGGKLVDFCVDGLSRGISEISLCIRSGYKTDNIGQFRRAFSKAAEVPLGPLGRMITDLNQKEARAKERFSKSLANQDDVTISEPPGPIEEEIEDIITERRLVEVRSTTRARNTRFRNAVLKAHGYKCACCGIDIPDLLEAAHIVPVSYDGTDHPSNGIALCPTHHSAFDRHYFTFEPGSRKLVLKADLTTSQLLITKESLEADINDECLALRQRLFNTEARG